MYNRPRSYRRQSSADYLMPFLIIICIGVILVLLFNLYKTIFGDDNVQGAYLHIVEGSVQMQTWNTEGFFDLSSDVLLLRGDEFKTSSDAKVIVEFVDGTIMRVAGGSDVMLVDVDVEGKVPSLELMLVDGMIWLNKENGNTGMTEISVKTDKILVKSNSTGIFEVENEFNDTVRVLSGQDVDVDIYTQDGAKVVESESVGVGQEAVFTDEVLDRYWQHKSPSVLAALDDAFKASKWYAWNVKEDDAPTEFVRVAGNGDGVFVQVSPEKVSTLGSSIGGEDAVEPTVLDAEAEVKLAPVDENFEDKVVETKSVEAAVSAAVSKPTITAVGGSVEVNPDGFYVVPSRLATLKGGVEGASKVVVNGYTLTKFNSGDKSWTYFANADFALMVKGENTYEVYAVGENGKKSESLFVKILHDPSVAPVVEPKPAPEPVVEDNSGIVGGE